MYLFLSLMVLSTCFPETLSITFFPQKFYRAATRGFEVHLADLCALILAVSMVLRPAQYKIKWFLPLTIPFCLYFFIAILSWILVDHDVANPSYEKAAINPEFSYSIFTTSQYPLFEMSKLLRGYFIFWVSANLFNDEKSIKYLVSSFAIMVFYFTARSLFQRYVQGEYRVSPLTEFNIFNCFIGMLGAFVTPFAFKTKKLGKSLIYCGVTVSALLSIILTVSRSSLAAYAASIGIATILSLRRFNTGKNKMIVFFGILLSMLFFIRAADTLFTRFFVTEPFGVSYEYREMFNEEARLMSKDHILGVGLGNFSAFSIETYGKATGAEPGAMAHNIWFLNLGELGYPGLLAFAIFWIRYFQILFKDFFTKINRTDELTYTCLIGILGAMIILQVQDLFHFAYRHTSIFLITQILIGITVRIYIDNKARKKKARLYAH